MFSAACLAETVDAAADHVILDLGGLDFIDSSGLGAILATHRRLAEDGRRLVVVCPDGSCAQKVLDLSGTAAYLNVAASRWDAVQRLPG